MNLQGKKFFLVDDSHDIRSTLNRVFRKLTKEGVEVTIFEDPAVLLATVAGGETPDLIMTDNDMPGMTGVVLSERLRAIGFDKPILMLTGDDIASVPTINKVLAKPFDPFRLMQEVCERLQ